MEISFLLVIEIETKFRWGIILLTMFCFLSMLKIHRFGDFGYYLIHEIQNNSSTFCGQKKTYFKTLWFLSRIGTTIICDFLKYIITIVWHYITSIIAIYIYIIKYFVIFIVYLSYKRMKIKSKRFIIYITHSL